MADRHNRILSYGGGVQSSALIILAALGEVPPIDFALFANTGDDSEHPKTLEYVREIMIPWAAKHGIEVKELRRYLKDGTEQSLWGRMMDWEGETLREPIPLYGYSGMPLSRSCTADHKIKVVGKWIKDNYEKSVLPIEVCVGISVDEIERAGRGRDEKWEKRIYPLLNIGYHRKHCIEVFARVGLPVPPKSSCFFCPFHSIRTWSVLRKEEPELFEKAAQLEDKLLARRKARDKGEVYLTGKGKPLREVIVADQDKLFGDEVFNDGKCDEGYCWT